MGRVIGRTLNQVIETDNFSVDFNPIWLAFELNLDFVDVDLFGLYFSARTLAADDDDITGRLHFVRYTIARNVKLNVANLTLSLQEQLQAEKTNKLWEKIAYGYFSADICHEWKHPFRLPAGDTYTIALDLGVSTLGFANQDQFRFCLHGKYLEDLEFRPKISTPAKEAKP